MTNHLKGAQQSALLEIGGIVLFAAVVALLDYLLNPALNGVALILVGIVLTLVPAAIWLLAFYRQDYLEPEPRQYVLGVFILGALLAQALGQPLIRDLFQVQTWANTDTLTSLLSAVLIVGVIQEFLKYAAVRYTVFGSAEFDQPVDGIIYGASAGLGYATMLNIQYVLGNGGVDLGVGVIRISIEALAQASFAGVMGYFLGQAKFRQNGPLWLPAGLLLAALLNGTITYLLDQLPLLGAFAFNPWYGLIGATLVAGATFAVLLTTIRRLNAAALNQRS